MTLRSIGLTLVVSAIGWGAVVGLCSQGPFAETGNQIRLAVPFPDPCNTAGCEGGCTPMCVLMGCWEGCFERSDAWKGIRLFFGPAPYSPPVPLEWRRRVDALR